MSGANEGKGIYDALFVGGSIACLAQIPPSACTALPCALKAGGTSATRESCPMSIDESTAAKVAKLARIKVEEDALPALAQEFNAVLGFIEQLNEVDVDGVEPMVSVTPMRLKRREDVVTDGDQQEKILSNAPE